MARQGFAEFPQRIDQLLAALVAEHDIRADFRHCDDLARPSMQSREIMPGEHTGRGEDLADGPGLEQLAIDGLNHRTRRGDHVPFQLSAAVQVLAREQDRDTEYSRQQASENQPEEDRADSPAGSEAACLNGLHGFPEVMQKGVESSGFSEALPRILPFGSLIQPHRCPDHGWHLTQRRGLDGQKPVIPCHCHSLAGARQRHLLPVIPVHDSSHQAISATSDACLAATWVA